MKKFALMIILIALSACGVDGEPVQPEGGTTVTLSSSGIGLNGSVGLRKGPFTVGLGF